ncbi:hypothetical protein KR026_001189, partial [Drosophila bipectinata]
RVGGIAITSQRAIKYLGVMIDARLSFREHLDYIQGKAAATTRGLARILLNTRGPKQNRRRLLVSVASAQILYAAPIWAETMNTPSYMRGVDAVYRLGAIRVASGFRTVSDDAILVIAGMVPLKERARELKELKETRACNEGAGGTPNTAAKKDAKERSLTAWQDCWDASTKGRWTHTLIPNLRRWVLQSHGQVDFYLTQVLSGHGCFRQRFGHTEDDWCPECGSSIIEDARHVVFECRRFARERHRLETTAGRSIHPGNLVEVMLENQMLWDAVATFAAALMQRLRSIEQERR